MPLYDFKCRTCGHKQEEFRAIEEREEPSNCNKCGEETTPVVSPTRTMLDGTDPSFPGEWMKWERKHRQKLAQEIKQSQD